MIKRITTLLLLTLLSACAQQPIQMPDNEVPQQVSRDYEAIGDATGIRPFVYGKHTLIKFDSGKPYTLTIKDSLGAAVKYKVQGGYYVLERKLDTFTLTGVGRSVQFSLIPPQIVNDPTGVSQNESDESDLSMLQDSNDLQPAENNAFILSARKNSLIDEPVYAVMYEQLQQQRKLLSIAREDSKYTGEELFRINAKLDDVEYKIFQKDIAVVHVYFPFNNTDFKPSATLVDAVLPLAKNAARINLYGRTDSKVPDDGNKIVANGRVTAAKSFLVKHGVTEDIIRTSSLASGDFIAPNGMEEGRKLNRRVTIEIVSR